jgi:hypothetical protein
MKIGCRAAASERVGSRERANSACDAAAPVTSKNAGAKAFAPGQS